MNTVPIFLRYLPLGLFLLASPALPATINDYDGDGKSDFAMYDQVTGHWTVLFSSLNYVPGARPIIGRSGWRPVPGDYDGDGKTDVAIMCKTGTWMMLMSSRTNELVSTNFGGDGAGPVTDTGPVPADYDGDGITDLAYYKKASGEWGILFADGQIFTGTWGGPGYVPVPADFDGDGKADRCVYSESTGRWYISLSGSGGLMAGALLGGPGYEAVPADYDGDDRADFCVYNKTTGKWYVLFSRSGYKTCACCTLGNVAYKPVPGDYDGDGRADLMVFADSIARWVVLFSGSGYSVGGLNFGGTNWSAAKSLWRENLVFMAFGDSITYGDGSSTDSPATGYPKLLETKLKQNYDGYISSINQGRDGEDTYQGVERFAQTLDATNPDLVLLMEGTNDHGDEIPFDEIEENLRIMIGIALGRSIPVIIATIPPVIANEYRDRSAQMARIVAFNPRIYRIASDLNIPVAPVFEAITAVPGWESLLMNQPSANHPNDAGYQVMRDAFYTPVTAGLDAGRY